MNTFLVWHDNRKVDTETLSCKMSALVWKVRSLHWSQELFFCQDFYKNTVLGIKGTFH